MDDLAWIQQWADGHGATLAVEVTWPQDGVSWQASGTLAELRAALESR